MAVGGVCVPSHPYKGYQRALMDKVKTLKRVAAYEAVNGQCAYQCPEANRLAQRAAQTAVCGSAGAAALTAAQNASASMGAECADVQAWDPAWVQLEDEVLRLVNERRAAGADCGSSGVFASAHCVTPQGLSRGTARRHARGRGRRHYMAHNTLEGTTPWNRYVAAGYAYRAAAENIAAGSTSAAAVMEQWMTDPPHCANVMDLKVTELGVGYAEAVAPDLYGRYWVQDFGAPQ